MSKAHLATETDYDRIFNEAAYGKRVPLPEQIPEPKSGYYRYDYSIVREPWETRYLSCSAWRWMFFRGGNSW